ncbi:MAG: phosphonate ABC transporter ATP-binding protein, partial [Marinobacter sp. 34-60-7]
MLEISNLVKRYGQNEPVLKGLDLTVEGSSVVAIVGASGAGKSTLLRCINRLVEPTSGSIKLNGLELSSLRGGELRQARRRIGMVFQGFNLIDRLSVMENVLSGRLGYVSFFQALTRRFPQSDIERAFHLMERVGIDHYANKRADQLSGGERQRVAVVRALMQEPEILLADEPTASLDPKTSQQ